VCPGWEVDGGCEVEAAEWRGAGARWPLLHLQQRGLQLAHRRWVHPSDRARRGLSGRLIQRVNLASGSVETLYTNCEGVPLHGPNDIVFDADGGFWFTDFGKRFKDRLMIGAVYYARPDGRLLRCAAESALTPNGIGLSPDGRTLYMTETETSRLWSYPVLGPGELAREPWPSPNGGHLVHGLPGYQRFDSLAVEEGGNICVATLVRGGISVFSPSGEWLEFLEAPRATAPTSALAARTGARHSSRFRAMDSCLPRGGPGRDCGSRPEARTPDGLRS